VTEINPSVDLSRDGDVALIAMRNPPVNALKHELREGIAKAIKAACDDPAVRVIVLAGSEKAFSAGADITEFGKPPREPYLPQVIQIVEDAPKPVVAAISGLALGGGLELALGCHHRLAWPKTQLGLPEIKLGLLPGAGGTQRLPRLVGVARALETIMSGDPMTAEIALRDGLVDEVMAGPFPGAAIDWARRLPATGHVRVRDREDKLKDAKANPKLIDEAASPLLKKARGSAAARACVEAVRASVGMSFDAALALERKLFMELLASDESKAQRHVFFAEREARKVPGLPRDVTARPVRRAAVIGAGTMGGGIAMCFANAGIPVTIIETERAALDRGIGRIEGNYETSVKRGSLDAGAAKTRRGLIAGGLDFGAVAEADFVIEAVFEEMDLKKKIFRELDRIAKPGAVLATNTSYLNIDEIAASTNRPADVLGTHFFSPANVMRLLEIVRGAKTAPDVLATAVETGRALGKVTVVVGVCDGFVGNRMLAKRSLQGEALLLEGASPHEIDAAMTDFGFKMGPFAVGDLAGLDIGWRLRKARGLKAPISDALCEAGRLGQKAGRGYYLYGVDGRTPTPDPEVDALIAGIAAKLGVKRRRIDAEEIVERLLFPMINEGARILEEGIAARSSDIDVIWLNGYGWPVTDGGPMFHADRVGLARIAARLGEFAGITGDKSLVPAPLLADLAKTGKGFASFAARAGAA
jgi:3-hydroxyacyl-CoA dehydrogenase